MTTTDRLAIVRVTPEVLATLLQLPRGAHIEYVRTTDDLGVLELRVRGAGWPCKLGERIVTAPTAVVRREINSQGAVVEQSVDWHLPQDDQA